VNLPKVREVGSPHHPAHRHRSKAAHSSGSRQSSTQEEVPPNDGWQHTDLRDFPLVSLPFSFAIPPDQLATGSSQEDAIYEAQVKFTEEMNSLPDPDPGSQEYAAQWKRSTGTHDDHLRLLLGGPRYIQLTALALQAEQAARERSQ